MFQRAMLCLVALGLTAALAVAEPQPIPQELCVELAKRLSEDAGKLPDAAFKVDADCDKATGLHEPEVAGLMVVPAKELKPDTIKGVSEDNGAPAGYLFLYKLSPVIDGKKLSADQLPIVMMKDGNGNERPVGALRLALKKEGEDKWKLLVFGKGKKPILTSPFRAEANNAELPLSVGVKDLQANEAKLIVTAFGKYAADVNLTKAE